MRKILHNTNKIVFAFIISLFATISVSAQSFSGGSGTENDPFLISSRADMEALATAVNNGNEFRNRHFLLTQDITDAVTTIIGHNLGFPSRPFRGVFDGGGHTITVNISTNQRYVGVFGFLTSATIKNLGVRGSIIRLNSSNPAYVGGIVGFASAGVTISNCFNTAYITAVSSDYIRVGGIVGEMRGAGSIANSYNTGNISASGNGVSSGGIVGSSWTTAGSRTITNSYNTGNISASGNSSSGGIIGITGSSVTITNSYNTGNISVMPSGGGTVGGISGNLLSGGTIQNSFVSNSQITGGTAGRITGSLSGTRQNNYADNNSVFVNGIRVNSQNEFGIDGRDVNLANLQNQSWLQSNLGWDFDNIWAMSDVSSVHQGLPILRSQLQISQHTISVSSGMNGTISPATDQIVAHGGSQTFTFSPNAGFEINQVLINGVNNPTAVSMGNFTFENVSENHSIAVTFKAICADVTELEQQLATANALINTLQTQNANLQNDLITANNTVSNLLLQITVLENELAECLNNNTSIGTQSITNVQLHPNPAQNFVYIQAEFWIERIEIFNASGIRVLAGAYDIRPNEMYRINLHGFIPGTYFVRIYGSGGVAVTKKLIVR